MKMKDIWSKRLLPSVLTLETKLQRRSRRYGHGSIYSKGTWAGQIYLQSAPVRWESELQLMPHRGARGPYKGAKAARTGLRSRRNPEKSCSTLAPGLIRFRERSERTGSANVRRLSLVGLVVCYNPFEAVGPVFEERLGRPFSMRLVRRLRSSGKKRYTGRFDGSRRVAECRYVISRQWDQYISRESGCRLVIDDCGCDWLYRLSTEWKNWGFVFSRIFFVCWFFWTYLMTREYI